MIYLEQRFHELAREYDTVHNEVVKQREIENQIRNENERLRKFEKRNPLDLFKRDF